MLFPLTFFFGTIINNSDLNVYLPSVSTAVTKHIGRHRLVSASNLHL